MMSSPRWHRILICCDLVGVFSAARGELVEIVRSSRRKCSPRWSSHGAKEFPPRSIYFVSMA
jgi:hypothetical protein